VSTLAVSKNGINCQLNINPDFWETLSDDEQLALLQHELSHIALQHIFLHDSFANTKIFNIAADAEVNSYIENLPKSACTAKWIGESIGKTLENGLGTKKYYEEIQNFMNKQQKANAQNPQKPCNGGQGGSSSQNQQSNSQSSQSNSSPSDASSDESQEDNKQEENQTPPSPSHEEKQESDNQSPEKENSQNLNCLEIYT
jgi:predicted metal-dependent peptidase